MEMNAEQLVQIIGKQTIMIEGLKATIQEMQRDQRPDAQTKDSTPTPRQAAS